MAYNANILLGKISKVQGYDGAVTIKLEKEFIGNIRQMESVFLEVEGKPVPFFISMSEYTGGDALKLRFEGYESYEKTSEFTGCRVFLSSGIRTGSPAEENENITGFSVILKDKTPVGKIEEIIRNPGQNLLKITSDRKKEILIPFHADLIIRIDEKRKILVVKPPEGLIDLN